MVRTALTILFATLPLACHRDPPAAVGEATITGANVEARRESADAVTRIVEARCAREIACNTVTDRSACATDMRTHLEQDIEPASCPRGGRPSRTSDHARRQRWCRCSRSWS